MVDNPYFPISYTNRGLGKFTFDMAQSVLTGIPAIPDIDKAPSTKGSDSLYTLHGALLGFVFGILAPGSCVLLTFQGKGWALGLFAVHLVASLVGIGAIALAMALTWWPIKVGKTFPTKA
jgi:hypothetical protein